MAAFSISSPPIELNSRNPFLSKPARTAVNQRLVGWKIGRLTPALTRNSQIISQPGMVVSAFHVGDLCF